MSQPELYEICTYIWSTRIAAVIKRISTLFLSCCDRDLSNTCQISVSLTFRSANPSKGRRQKILTTSWRSLAVILFYSTSTELLSFLSTAEYFTVITHVYLYTFLNFLSPKGLMFALTK